MDGELSTPGPRALHRRRRIRWLVTAVVVLAVLGTVTGVALTRLAARPAAAQPQAPSPATTAEVTRADLAERRSVTGTLGYGAESTLTGRKPGTITALPAQGAVLARGQFGYQVDARPVPLFYAGIPLYRDLAAGMTDGPDVQVVEENLTALGFGGFGTPNTKFTNATTNAIKKWQKAIGLDQTGVIGRGDVVTVPGPVRISTVTAALGDQGTGGVLKYTNTNRAVAVELKAAYKDLAKPGTKVTLTMAGQSTTGTIATLVPTPDDGNDSGNSSPGDSGQSEPQFTATITLDDPAAFGEADAGLVGVRFTTSSRQDVLVVPVGALLALAEGGYAVEVVEGANHQLVAVRPGLFADGRVEVSSEELQAGMRVVTTS